MRTVPAACSSRPIFSGRSDRVAGPGPVTALVRGDDLRAERRADPGAAARDLDHLGLEEVGLADEVGDEAADRLLVDLRRRADLLHPTLAHDRDAVGHVERLLLVVGDEDEGDAGLALQRAELVPHRLAELEVERRERLVEQQHLRLRRQRAGERDRAALAAGELRRLAAGEGGHVHHPEHLGDARVCAARLSQPRFSSPKATFWASVMCGNSA